mgnify:CR=1 FL=1
MNGRHQHDRVDGLVSDVAAALGVPKIATGDVLRAAVKAGTPSRGGSRNSRRTIHTPSSAITMAATTS